MGGPDAEHTVSIQSGTAVANALESSGHFEVNRNIIEHVTVDELLALRADVFFPVLHGPYGEGGPLQELLEQTGVPFVGSSSLVSARAMDKGITKEIAQSVGIQTPSWSVLTREQPCNLTAPLVLKPCNDGSSIDMSICFTESKLQAARKLLHKNRSSILVETYIDGRELTVGIIDGKPLPIIEIIPAKEVRTYDFAAKYVRNDTQYIINPDLPPNNCIESALLLYQTMEVRDIARVDFMLDEGGAWLLEINTIPGFTDHSLVPMAAKDAGLEMPDLCSTLVELALARTVKSH
jgi:D-alanine-D-alanine ligase